MGNLSNGIPKVAISCATLRGKIKRKSAEPMRNMAILRWYLRKPIRRRIKKFRGKVWDHFSALIRGECKAEGMFIPYSISIVGGKSVIARICFGLSLRSGNFRRKLMIVVYSDNMEVYFFQEYTKEFKWNKALSVDMKSNLIRNVHRKWYYTDHCTYYCH